MSIDPNFLIIGLAILIIAFILYIFGLVYIYYVKAINIKYKKESEFTSAIIRGMESGIVTSIDDALNIYKGVYQDRTDDNNTRNHINQILCLILFTLSMQDKKLVSDPEEIPLIKALIDKLLVENKKIAPFADLPIEERNILNDIMQAIDSSNLDMVRHKINQLTTDLKNKNDIIAKQAKDNRYSTYINIVSIVLSVVFGVISILLSLKTI